MKLEKPRRMYLPDTNVIIRGLAGYQPESDLFQRLISKERLVFSVVNVAEFLAKATDEEAVVFNRLIEPFRILRIDREVAALAAVYRKQMARKSEKNVLIDCFLASQAKINKLTLITNNLADFPIKDIEVISPSKLAR